MPETFNYDTQTISILVRRMDETRVTLNYSSSYDCHESVSNDIGPDDKILLVAIGDKVIYSRLCNDRECLVEDIFMFCSREKATA